MFIVVRGQLFNSGLCSLTLESTHLAIFIVTVKAVCTVKGRPLFQKAIFTPAGTG